VMKVSTLILNGWFATAIALNAADTKPAALAHFAGPDFQGGAKDLYGSSFDGEQVNYVYAAPTGKHSTMQVKFSLKAIPQEAQFAHLKARDDDGPKACAIAIELNGKVLFEGANEFSSRGNSSGANCPSPLARCRRARTRWSSRVAKRRAKPACRRGSRWRSA
jgi:hypothetical protein